ncbi:hypothetical protein [Natronolimnobius sp. AArcel1]|nr:hypothetical protein [Natronolimnobius sp. AArcel1]
MALDTVLSGDQLTGRQAAIIFFAWLALVIAAGVVLLLFTRTTIG